MLYVAFGMGLLFLGLAFLINADNAKTWLSGYNTMSEEEQRAFPIDAYLKEFKRFHLLLGFVFIVLTVALNAFSPMYVGYHLGLTPIVAYIFFFIRTRKFSEHTPGGKSMQYVAIGVLIATLIGVLAMFRWSDRPTTLEWTGNTLHISGPYGLELAADEIDSLHIGTKLPSIRIRTHGISTGKASKGKFRGKDGVNYHLLVDKPVDQVLTIYGPKKTPVVIAINGVNEQELYDAFLSKKD